MATDSETGHAYVDQEATLQLHRDQLVIIDGGDYARQLYVDDQIDIHELDRRLGLIADAEEGRMP